MAKRKTSKKKPTTKGTKKSSTKGKKKVTKKKTTTKKAAKAVSKKETTTKKKTTTKKAVAPKKKTATVKSVSAKAKMKKKPAAVRTLKEVAGKKTTVSRSGKKTEVQKRAFESTVQSRADAIKKIKGYSKSDLEHFKAIIIEKRDEILEDLQSLKEQMLDPTTGEYINENSPYSLHMAEQGTDAMEREKTFLYAQRENKFLGYLDDALKRIETEIYGICVECIEEPQLLCETCPLVPKARLEAVPHTQHCLPIKQRKSGH